MPTSQESLVEEIKKRLDIVDLVGTYISLKRSGKNYVGLCPFHDDKNPSLHLNQDKGLFHCFSCGEGGDIFGFLMKYNNLSFKEALEELAKKANIEIKENSKSEKKNSRRKVLFEINSLALSYFQKNLLKEKKSNKAREYLKRRGINLDVAREFKLGFAPDSWDGLLKFLMSKKVPLKLALELGLIVTQSNGPRQYDRFRNRIIFPILDVGGEVIGFGGRVLDKNDDPKYLNSPESPIYRKRNSFYGLYNSKDDIRRKQQAILVEGYMDLISLYRSGFKNVAATLGTSLTNDHATFIKRYCENVFILYDGDISGVKSAIRAGEIFLEQGIMPKVVVLPDGSDPDTFINEFGVDELEKLIEESDFLPDQFLKNTFTDFKGGKLSRKLTAELVMNFLSKIKSSVDRSHYITKASGLFGFRENDLYLLIKTKKEVNTSNFKYKTEDDLRSYEYLILKIILNFPDTISYLVGQKFLYLVEESPVKEIINEIVKNGFTDINSLLNKFSDSDAQNILSEAVFSTDGVADEAVALKMLKESIARLKLKHISDELKSIRMQVQDLQSDVKPEAERRLLEEYNSLVKQEKEIKEKLYEN